MNTHRASMITRVGPLAALSLTAAALLALALPACSGEGDEQQGDCPADEEFYEREVWDAFASMTCYGCHNPEGTAKATRMILDPDDVAHNMEVMATLAAEQVDGASLLLLKPTMTHPDGHGGGMVLKPDSPEYAALAEFVARADGSFVCEDGEGEAPSCEEIGAGPRALRRLSHVEYDNSVQDLLGVSGELGAQAASFAPDNVINGFTNNASALTVSSLLVEQYREAAEALADHVVENQAQYLSCAPADGQSCAESFVRSFGARAFRRPVTDEEVARYAALYQAIAPEDGFDVGLRWVVAALLQSPNFLYRSELGEHQGDGVYALTPHEVAAELSYLVLGTTPDEELRALAEDGTILDPAVLEAQAQRLLA
ncbi:MAG: DUF1595 domain-containing protein, partial [Myxococcales bacterium]|nr:DUF1595 domain-containing protein [Myxococcales bacterium]